MPFFQSILEVQKGVPMRLFKIVSSATAFVAVFALASPDAVAAKKDEFADTRVCVKLGLETNHPFEKVCTRKVATVEAAKWTQEKESIHFVYMKSGSAFTGGNIKPRMDGGTAFEPGQLNICIMEVPSFRGTEDEVFEHKQNTAMAFYYAARDSGNDFDGAKSYEFVQRNKSGMFPESCDVVAATGASWLKSWTKVVEQISVNSGPNTKFGQEFKQSFTDTIGDLALAFSLSPADVSQGTITAQAEVGRMKQERDDAKSEVDNLLTAGSTEGLVFLALNNSSDSLCHSNPEHEAVLSAVKANADAVKQLNEWGTTTVNQHSSVEEIFQKTLAGECGATMSSPSDAAQLRSAFEKRNQVVTLGWVQVQESDMTQAREVVAAERAEVLAAKAAEEAKRREIESWTPLQHLTNKYRSSEAVDLAVAGAQAWLDEGGSSFCDKWGIETGAELLWSPFNPAPDGARDNGDGMWSYLSCMIGITASGMRFTYFIDTDAVKRDGRFPFHSGNSKWLKQECGAPWNLSSDFKQYLTTHQSQIYSKECVDATIKIADGISHYVNKPIWSSESQASQ